MADITITRTIVLPEEASVSMLVRDRFDIPSEDGKRQSMFSPYHPRIIHDDEGVISEDNGALRIRPKSRPGWGTSSLVYGPFAREGGLTFATVLLNGHNASQTDSDLQSAATRINQWLQDNASSNPAKRAWRWLSDGERRRTMRQFRQWRKNAQVAQSAELPQIDENLAVGWFDEAGAKRGGNPLLNGSALVMRAAGAANGTLCALSSQQLVEAVPDMMNVPICLVTVLRPTGAAYYAASIGQVGGLPDLSEMRPIAIDTSNSSKTVYAGIDQSVLGQGGFNVSTRVFDARIARVGAWQHWYGTAHLADNLRGKGALESNSAETDQHWKVRGTLWRTPDGTVGSDDNYAQTDAPAPNGLIHTQISSDSTSARVALYWRVDKTGNGWRVILSPFGSVVQCSILGSWIKIGSTKTGLKLNQTQALQIRDNGDMVGIDLDGELLFEFDDRLNGSERGIGFALSKGAKLHNLESHARSIKLPDRFGLEMPYVPKPGIMTVWDELTGNGEPLHRSKTTMGAREWQMTLGEGEFQRDLRGTEVLASTITPNPGRSLYTFNWHDIAFASLAVDIMPPGTARGQGERGRGGLVFWQDPENYIVISTWLDDSYAGASISSFYRLNGVEEMFDTVWTNVGRRIEWGKSYNLRADFDGAVFMIYLNNKPVLYRAVSDVYPEQRPVKIKRVGLAVNWEWGDDTGSLFENFVARGGDRLAEATRISFGDALNGSADLPQQ